MFPSSISSPRPTSVTSYSTSSPRLSLPLNPSPKSFSPPLPSGNMPRNSPVGEMSDTLSPLRERHDPGLASPPRTSPAIPRSSTSSFSRSPERSPVMCATPYRAYARHPSPSSSPFTQNIPFPTSPPLTGPPQPPMSQSPRPLSPPCNSPMHGSPASFHTTCSQFQPRHPYSPPHSTQSHFNVVQSSPVQIIPSPSSRYPRTQSLIQQSFGNQYAAQVASSPPNHQRNRRVSLGAESCPRGSPPAGHLFAQNTSTLAEGNSTPVNEAPIRWWGGRRGWDDDWDNLAQGPRACDPYATHSSGHSEPDGTMERGFALPGYGNPLAFREPFGWSGGPGAFLDEEIHASFDGVAGVGACFVDPMTPNIVHAPMGVNVGYTMEGTPVPRTVPIPMPLMGTRSGICNVNFGYREVDVALPPVDGAHAMQRTSDILARRHSCHIHPQGNASGFMPDGRVHCQERGQDGLGLEKPGVRGRRFSDASTRSSMSYMSCMSGPSQSQSQSLLMSPSQSHTSTCPSLSSLGIGIEESEREELRTRTFWGRRNSGSTIKRESKHLSHGADGHDEGVGQERTSPQSACPGEKCGSGHTDSPKGEPGTNVKTGAVQSQSADSKKSATPTQEKDIVKHGSLLFRVGLKHGGPSDEQTRQEGYNRAERCVSLAITSIFPDATVTTLSPVGEALVRARESAKYVGQELAPVVKDTLSMSAGVLSLTPFVGLQEAAKALLSVWDACQKVDTNRLSCLRLAERCATLLYSVRCELHETGSETDETLVEPVQRLCGALAQIRSFLETQLRRPFLKRYVRREEIARELQACNDAIADVASRFSISIQIRTYHQVCTAAVESKRFAREAQAMLTLDYQIIQRQCAMMCEQQVQVLPRVAFPRDSNVGITAGRSSESTNEHLGTEGEGCDDDRGRLTPPPVYRSPLQPPPPATDPPSSATDSAMSAGSEFGLGQDTPMSSVLSTGQLSTAPEPAMSAPQTPTPTRATFVAEETKTSTMNAKTELVTPADFPINALKEVSRAQDSVDAAVDEASLRGTLEGALSAQNDVEIVRCLQVARGEIPEAAETLRRMLSAGVEGGVGENHHVPSKGASMENTELDQRFMRSGIEALTRLTTVDAKQPRAEGEHLKLDGTGAVAASELPSWTITRYEVVRTRKIGVGFFADVYLGHWRDRTVVIKVLAHNVSREAFLRHVELWTAFDHPNVLPLYGASSAVGEKPWFFVGEFCSGGNLVTALQLAREGGVIALGDLATVRVDLLRFMHEIAKGMAYLHGHGVLHGDLRAANVLVNKNGQCMLSDFGQCEIKAEAHQSCGQPKPHSIRWKGPEMLTGVDRPTTATDVYAFAMCCVEILGMGVLPWASLDDKAIHVLVLDKDERPPIPVLAEYAEVTEVVSNLIHSCWAREPDRRPSFASIAASLEDNWRHRGHGSPQVYHASTPSKANKSGPVTPAESSPGDEQYETASESMMIEVQGENVDGMMDVPLTSPAPALGNGNMARSTGMKVLTQLSSCLLEHQSEDTPAPSLTNRLDMDTRNEENYRLIMGANHAFHSSLTLPLWSPTHVELGAVGYLSKPKGKFITLFNAIDPLQSCEERLRRLPSMYGYGKFEVQKREDGKRSVAQRGLDAISGFLTFKARGDRSHPERIARQYAFPLVQGKVSAHLCVEKTIHRYMDHLEAPTTWFEQYVDLILEVYGPHYRIQREDLILVVETLDAPDWAVFVSDDHADGRAQFNVFSGREKGEPWGMYTTEQAIKNGGRMDVSQGTFASKVSCVTLQGNGHDVVGDTVMLAGLRFERGSMQAPTVI